MKSSLYLVLLSVFLCWPVAILDSRILYFFPDGVLLALFLYKTSFGIRIPNPTASSMITFLLLGTISIVVIVDGRGVGSGGSLLAVIETFMIFCIIAKNKSSVSLREIDRVVHRLYAVLIISLLIELIARLMGFIDVMALLGSGSDMKAYKTYNTGAILNYFDIAGLNSLILGSQSASQINAFAIIVFLQFKEVRRRSSLWLFFALAFYPLNATMTSNIILLIYILILFALNSDKLFGNRLFRWGMIISILIGFEQIALMLAFRVNESADIDVYSHAFTHIYDVLQLLSFDIILLGWGASLDRPIWDTNFGFGAIAFQAGFPFLLVIMFFCIRSIYLPYKMFVYKAPIGSRGMLFVTAVINLLLAGGWFVSLIHYTPAIELGGRHIFSFHMAICMYLAHIYVPVCLKTSDSTVLRA